MVYHRADSAIRKLLEQVGLGASAMSTNVRDHEAFALWHGGAA